MLKRKLDLFLQKCGGGKVIDINFVPNYDNMLTLERNRAEINYFKNVIRRDERSFVRRYLYPRVLQTNGHIEEAIKSIDSSLEKEVEMPVFSGGHAFVCFDSILSTYLCLIAFQ